MTQQVATQEQTLVSDFSAGRLGTTMGTGTALAAFDLQTTVHAARLGDDTAFAALVNQYQATAQRVAQHILRTEEAAADAVQDALIKAHRAMPRFQDGNFRSWLLRIVTNTCYDHLRRQRRRAAVSLDELVDENGLEIPGDAKDVTEDPAKLAMHRENMETILAAIDSLPPWHRNVVLLVDVHGYDYSEAAELLDLPLGTVKSRLSRARSALRDSLTSAGLVPPNRLAA
jgi:RNA polymerase sigma-70 factor (ECF subfamily)